MTVPPTTHGIEITKEVRMQNSGLADVRVEQYTRYVKEQCAKGLTPLNPAEWLAKRFGQDPRMQEVIPPPPPETAASKPLLPEFRAIMEGAGLGDIRMLMEENMQGRAELRSYKEDE